MLVTLAALGVGYAAAPAARSISWPTASVAAPATSNGARGVLDEPSSHPCQAWIDRAEELEVTISGLREELTIVNAAPPPTGEASPVEGPPGWKEQLGEAELVRVFRQALAEAGTGGATVDVELTSVDCTEYPCILYGHTGTDEQILDDFLRAPAFEAMASLERRVLSGGRGRLADREGERRHFGLAWFPRAGSAEQRQKIGQRLAFRAQLMWEATGHNER